MKYFLYHSGRLCLLVLAAAVCALWGSVFFLLGCAAVIGSAALDLMVGRLYAVMDYGLEMFEKYKTRSGFAWHEVKKSWQGWLS